jgi:hypothetical protein
MAARIVYINARDIPIPLEDLNAPEGEGEGNMGRSNVLIREVYREAGQDDGTLDGTLWERIAERATLGA